MDDYETHDDRRLLPGTGFTIEPGALLRHFGVRTEINMFVGTARRGERPVQAAIVAGGVRRAAELVTASSEGVR